MAYGTYTWISGSTFNVNVTIAAGWTFIWMDSVAMIHHELMARGRGIESVDTPWAWSFIAFLRTRRTWYSRRKET